MVSRSSIRTSSAFSIAEAMYQEGARSASRGGPKRQQSGPEVRQQSGHEVPARRARCAGTLGAVVATLGRSGVPGALTGSASELDLILRWNAASRGVP